MSTCKQWREGDENVCTCGYRWDVKDEDPHNYANESKAQAQIEEEHWGDRDVAKYEGRQPYGLAPILQAKLLHSPLFKSVLANSSLEGDSYTEMLEKALFLHIEKAEDAERNLLKYVRKYGADTLTDNEKLVERNKRRIAKLKETLKR